MDVLTAFGLSASPRIAVTSVDTPRTAGTLAGP